MLYKQATNKYKYIDNTKNKIIFLTQAKN